MTVDILKEQATTFIISKANDLFGGSRSGLLFMPAIKMAVKNNIDKADGFLKMLTDKNGDIDALGLIQEYEESLINSPQKVTFDLVEFGEGKIRFDIPFADKVITLDAADIEELKSLLTQKTTKNVTEI